MMPRLRQIILYDLEKIILIYNKIMTINDHIRDGKLQYDINRKDAEISALSSGEIDNILLVKKYCHLITTNNRTS